MDVFLAPQILETTGNQMALKEGLDGVGEDSPGQRFCHSRRDITQKEPQNKNNDSLLGLGSEYGAGGFELGQSNCGH